MLHLLAFLAICFLAVAVLIWAPAALVGWIVARVYDFAMREGRE